MPRFGLKQLCSVLATLLLPACAQRDTGQVGAAPDPHGEWIIVGHRIPGTSAMTQQQAADWHGRALRYGLGLAICGDDSCRAPGYRNRSVAVDSLFTDGFRLRPRQLGLKGGAQARATLTEVVCGGEPWPAVGATRLWVTSDHAYTWWDGVFFELKRANTRR